MITLANLINLSNQLPVLEDGEGGLDRGPYGSTQTKSGAVIHHDGATPIDWQAFSADPVTFFTGRAWFHINKNWGTSGDPVYGSGIMYQVGIGPKGEAYQLRPLMNRLWHCGNTALNEYGLAIYFPTGGNQAPTPVMIQRLFLILDEYRAQTQDARTKVFGHGEVTSTACPGPALQTVVDVYRKGPTTPPTDDEKLEYYYLRNPAQYGEKMAKIWLKRPYYTGDALRCERAILTLDGADILNYVVDDGLTLLGDRGEAGAY